MLVLYKQSNLQKEEKMSENKIVFEPTTAQVRAKSFKGADLLVSAGAGSGKTSTLAERIIEELASGESLSRKLVVTYTNDAANELRSKISTSLTALLASDKSNQVLATQLVELASADICTIDSFCLKIVRESFELLSLDGGFKMADESETEVLCRDAMDEVIDTLYEERGDDRSFLAVCECFGAFSSEQRLKDDLLKLYKHLVTTKDGLNTLLEAKSLDGDFIDTPYGAVIKHYAICICRHYTQFFERALEEIKDNSEAMGAYGDAFGADRDFARELESVAKNGTYAQIGAQIETYSPVSLKSTTDVEGVDTKRLTDTRNGFKSAIRKTLKELFCLSEDQIKWAYEQNGEMCRALYDVLKLFESEYTKKKRSASVCDFNDISHYALKLLYNENGEISTLAREIAERYDEVYVDEYQDTNYIQDRIFYAISRQNRFLVGDIKQSIYAFRSADPSIFSGYRRGFTPLPIEKEIPMPSAEELRRDPDFKGAQIAMSENFRCDETIIDFSNAVSNHMFLSSNGIPYDKSDELKFKKPDCDYVPDKAEVYLIDKSATLSDDEDDEALTAEAEFVAQKIAELLSTKAKLANGKQIEPEDITILLRGFSRPVSIYRSALEKRGIPSVYRGDERFFEKAEVLLALCVLNAIDNPMRDVYLAGAMRSCVFNFSLEELALIRKDTEADSLYGALKEYKGALYQRVSEFLERLQHYRDRCRTLSCCEALSLIYADTSLMTSASESERRSLLKLYSIARSYEAGKNKGLYGFLRYVEGIKEGSAKEMLGDDEKGSVRLMSVHASKGLQFEVCFVSACGAQINPKDASADMIFVDGLGVNTYVYRQGGLVKYNTVLRKTAQIAKKRECVEEEMRMLYVAMTRARSRLIITGALDKPEEFLEAHRGESASEYSTLNPSCYLDWILHAVADTDIAKIEIINQDTLREREATIKNYEQEARDTEGEAQDIDEILKTRLEFEYPYQHLSTLPSKLSVSQLSASVLDKELDDDDGYELDDLPSFAPRTEAEASATDIGTATHTFLQFCDFERLEANGFESELERLRSEEFLSPVASELVRGDFIEKFLKSELFGEIKRAKRVHRELRFNMMFPTEGLYKTSQLEGQSVLVQGIFDLVLENENGEVVLVDYKTDDVTEENYETKLPRSHHFQLKYYKEAVRKMFKPKTLTAKIYSVVLGKSVRV